MAARERNVFLKKCSSEPHSPHYPQDLKVKVGFL